jgi:hypothetical protein
MATDYTLAALRQRVHNMALTDDTTNTLADTFINDVYADLVVQGQLKCTVVNKNLTSGTNLYTFSTSFSITDLGMVQYIMYKANGQTQGYILEPSDLETVLQLNSTNPTGYVRKYAFQGLDNLYLWPAPQSTGDTLQIYYAQTPTVLSSAGDVPSAVPSQWQHLISLGAAARMVDAVGEDITLGTALQAKYEALYKQFVKWVKGRQGRGTQVMASGYARSTSWPPHDRSSYYSETGPGS